MVYIMGWLLNYWTFVVYELGLRFKFILFLPIFFFGLIIILRDSGTDTGSIYRPIFSDMLLGVFSPTSQGWEPGFLLLAKSLLWLTGSEVVSLQIISGVYVALLSAFLVRADRIELRIFLLYYLPVFVYMHGMNTVRVGLGGAIFLLAWQALRRKQIGMFWLFGLSSMLFHYSMIIPLFVLAMSEYRLTSWKVMVPVFIAFITLAITISLREDYFENKLNLYSRVKEAPSFLSATSRTALICLLWSLFAISRVPSSFKVRTFLGLILPTFTFQALVLVSYAGIRLVDLMSFLAPLLLVRQFDLDRRTPSKLFFWGVGFAGLLGAGFVYRNFLTDFEGQASGTPTPFLPYRTIFDEWP